MERYREEDFLSLAGIQHFVYCRRQWALIHIEQQWADNFHTAEGNVFHDRAHDEALHERRGDMVITRGIPVFSRELGINGVCDIVEFHRDDAGVTVNGLDGLWHPIPVEYKKGSPKPDECDILQVLAQAICLEEMLLCKIAYGYLYYGDTRHREKVLFTGELRNRLKQITEEMHGYYQRGYVPKVKTGKQCKACSLREICLPVLCKNRSAKKYINAHLEEPI